MSSWTPIVGRFIATEAELSSYIKSLPPIPWAKLVTWHNTQAPNLVQWANTEERDRQAKLVPGITRIKNLESYFKGRGWPSAPHWFVVPSGWWAFTPMSAKGTHSPSWNGTGIGIEMVADFAVETDESGLGAQVKAKTIALTAMLCDKTGIMPAEGLGPMPLRPSLARGIRLHKEDPATTHDCPGKLIAQDKAAMIQAVIEYQGHAGEHVKLPEELPPVRIGTTNTPGDSLNLRDNSSASGRVLTKLANGAIVSILNSATNGTTRWLYVEANNLRGWVSARYVKEN